MGHTESRLCVPLFEAKSGTHRKWSARHSSKAQQHSMNLRLRGARQPGALRRKASHRLERRREKSHARLIQNRSIESAPSCDRRVCTAAVGRRHLHRMVQDLLRHASEGRCRINCHLQAVTLGAQSINILVRLPVKTDRMDKCSSKAKAGKCYAI